MPTPTRACGECTLCCKLLLIEELNKPVGQWCQHCRVGQGCGVYQERPAPCRSFQCLWLLNEQIPEELRPDKVKAFLSSTTDGKHLAVYVDPSQPNAYAKGPLKAFLGTVMRAGFQVITICGEQGKVLERQP